MHSSWMQYEINFYGFYRFEFPIFSFKTPCYTMVEETSQPYYLPLAGDIIAAFIPFPMILELCEMPTASYRIWTQFTKSISHDGK